MITIQRYFANASEQLLRIDYDLGNARFTAIIFPCKSQTTDKYKLDDLLESPVHPTDAPLDCADFERQFLIISVDCLQLL